MTFTGPEFRHGLLMDQGGNHAIRTAIKYANSQTNLGWIYDGPTERATDIERYLRRRGVVT